MAHLIGGHRGRSRPAPTEPPAEIPAPTDAEIAVAGVWGLGGRSVLLLANLVTTPFLIRLLGPSRYGLWALLLVVMTWASVADLGTGSASTRFAAASYARGDVAGEVSAIWTGVALVVVTTGCVAIVAGVAAPRIVGDLLHGSGPLMAEGTMALRLVCAVLVLQSVTAVTNTPPIVRLRWRSWTTLMTAAGVLGAAAAPLALAVLGGGLVTVAWAGLAAAAGAVLANVGLAVRMQPALVHPRLDWTVMRRFLSYGGALTVATVALVPLTTAERFFLAHDRSATAVAYYAVAANLATTLQVLPEQLVAPLLPGLARLHAVDRLDQLRAVYRKALDGLFVVVTAAAVLLAAVARPFLSFWAGPRYGLESTAPFLILVVGVWFNSLAWVPNSFLLASGRTRAIAIIKVAELAPFLAAAWVLTHHYGVIGAAWAWSGRCALDSIVLFAVAHRAGSLPVLPRPDRPWRAVAAPAALGAAALVLSAVVDAPAGRLVGVAALAAVYGAGAWAWVLSGRERQRLGRLVSDVTQRRVRVRRRRATGGQGMVTDPK